MTETQSPVAVPSRTDGSFDPVPLLAEELSLPRQGVSAVAKLLAEGATVPFIARYRKEATGGLDEVQIRAIEERRAYLLELEERRATVLAEIQKQGKLSDALASKIRACRTKAELEDLYLPFKPKRRTRAIIAKERGLEPLADRIWSQVEDGSPEEEARAFVSAEKEVPDTAAALAGARDICAERIAEHADVRKLVRDAYAKEGVIKVQKNEEHEGKQTKFDMYASFEEPVANIPSHRYLAIRRGEAEGVLRAAIELAPEPLVPPIHAAVGLKPKSPWAGELTKAADDAVKRLLLPAVQSDVRVDLKMQADRAAVEVFAQNLRELLLAAPFGTKAVLGIDPGQRTGCKCAVVDETGKLLEHTTIYLVGSSDALERARQDLRRICRKYPLRAVAVGNGTHGRETEAFAKDVLASEGLKEMFCVPVSEAGASVYSASEVAREEFPDLDLTVRGAISIARRLQDPLAELVKVDPKSIGVGQYQHDVYQGLLARKLDEVVESCVNLVGVELNTASAPLLARVAGIGPSLAKKIVAHRDLHGAFKSRKGLLDVAGVGPRTFEQAAGFLRVRGGEHPLDASAVHPERYGLVERIATDLGVPVGSLIGDTAAIARIDPKKYQSGDVGSFTLNDILSELKKPGRDPRATFEPPKFRDDVRTMEDLKPGMELEGVVTNVTAFGAFVDIGVHQDGLVHVSQLADRFVKDPNEVAKVGEKIKVRVLEVDLVRKRISLTAKKGGAPAGARPQAGGPPAGDARGRNDGRKPAQGQGKGQGGSAGGFRNNPFADLLRK
ncbi:MULTISPECIES: Tex family protein [Sorangium]|uniref:Transcription accessory protein n=1 Tax=Sorangium cellulosum TaxID=56 RepID=A0A4P2QTH8_SORCE|nr:MULTISPECIES: Tex family protein [Sorangium]AUX33428.1 transcription accessory protein [Sorangium cellulosum]WCQ92744.1 Protein YhgF [Sorangium sp. Soce836]